MCDPIDGQILAAHFTPTLDQLHQKQLAPYIVALPEIKALFDEATKNIPEFGPGKLYVITPEGAVVIAEALNRVGVQHTFRDKYAKHNGYHFIADDVVVALQSSLEWAKGIAPYYGLLYMWMPFNQKIEVI